MRDKPGERQLLAELKAQLHEYPAAGLVAGIVAVEGLGKVLRTEVNTVGFTGLHCMALACALLERASEEICATGPTHLVAKIEKALAALDIQTVDIRIKH